MIRNQFILGELGISFLPIPELAIIGVIVIMTDLNRTEVIDQSLILASVP